MNKMNWHDTINYELPLNEHMRLCLRLEHLFSQIQHFFHERNPWHSRATLDAILEIINIIDRPDLKGMLCKELNRHHATLHRLQQTPNIDHSKLAEVLIHIESINQQLNAHTGKLGSALKQNEFLTNLSMYRTNPAGICAFDVPAYHYWLQLPYEYRCADITTWLSHLELIQDAITLLLQLIRESAVAEFKTAEQGLYQIGLDAKTTFQLIRVCIPKEIQLFPEMSAGKHRMYIRFLIPSSELKPKQTCDDVLFMLTCCAL